MATVYRARQESMGRDVAIKVVPLDTDESNGMVLQRFEREVRLIAQLQHPRILPVYDYGQSERVTYLVMRLIETGTLADRLEGGPLDLDEATHILDQLAAALDYAHQHGVIHRDLKPSNVFLDAQGNAYLADFGIAKLLERVGTQLTASGHVLGTPAYMSPKQATDQPIDQRTDVYALGLILFEMLTGQQVFSGDSPISIILKHVNEPPPMPSTLAGHLTPLVDRVVTNALAKSPDDRYQTAGELAAAFRLATQSSSQPTSLKTADVFEGAAKDSAAQVPLTSEAVPTATRRPNWKWLVGGGLLAVLALALVSVVVIVGLLTGANDKDLVTTPQSAAAVKTAVTPTPTVTRPVETIIAEITPIHAAVVSTDPAPSATPQPTATPSPTVEPATETPADVPPSPTIEPTPLPPTPTPATVAQQVGRARFLSTVSRLDTVNLQLAGIEAAPTGKHYEGWLIGDSGNSQSIGIFAPDANGNVDFVYTDPEERNLAATYPGFRASLEPDFGDSPEISQEVIFEGAVNSAIVPLVREAILRSPETPLRSLLDGLETETDLGRDHLGFAHSGLINGNLADGLNHTEHVMNILTGSADPRFGDKNGDGQAQNPGDGLGVLGYLNALLAKANAARQADPNSAELALHVGFLQAVIQNSLQRTEGIVQLAERSFIQDSAASALTLNDQATALYDELLNGLDINGNGTVEPVQGEGGILLVVEHTGYLANIQVYRAETP